MAEIEKALGYRCELIKGDAGVFDVVADGDLVFSKHSVDRFPEPGEIVETLRRRA